LIYRFEDYCLDVDRQELSRGKEPVAVEPQVLDLLQYIIRNRERVVSKDDLIEHVWHGRIVSDSTLTSRITAARHAIGDSGDHQRLIRTIARKGIRFVGDVRDDHSPAAGKPASASAYQPPPREEAAKSKLSLVVLPFTNLGGDAEQDYFVDGLTDDLTTELSRLPGSFVIARNTAFTFKGKIADVKQIRRELGVRYVLEGSVRKAGQRVRVNAQLIDAETGGHLWADRFDREIIDLFALQDSITIELARVLGVKLIEAESRSSKRELVADAFDLEMQARAAWNRGWSRENFAAANRLFDQALELDPNSVSAMSSLATGLAIGVVSLWTEAPEADLRRADALAAKALALDPHDPFCHYAVGLVRRMQRRFDDAISELEASIRLNPNAHLTHTTLGITKVLAGRGEEALSHFADAIRLSPRDPLLFIGHFGVGWAEFLRAHDAQAVEMLRKALALNPGYTPAHLFLTAAYAMQDRLEEAREALAAYLRTNPTANTITLLRANAQSTHPAYMAQRERLYEGMRRAGLPAP
jgi:TolB-like protein/cytochrome c-type biogenesis protein CcmH/NrfG